MILNEKIAAQLPDWRNRVRKLVKESGEVVVDQVTISQIYGGARNIKCLGTDISYVDPNEGIRFRGFTIPELIDQLPKPAGAEMPYVGGLYYLLLVGEIPSEAEALEVEKEWKGRSEVPQYIFDILLALPSDIHPLTMFSVAVLAMQRESLFARQYHGDLKKEDYWIPTLEDSLNLTAKLPAIAAIGLRRSRGSRADRGDKRCRVRQTKRPICLDQV